MHGMNAPPIHDPNMTGGYNVHGAQEPATGNLIGSGLPPMSTFRNSGAALGATPANMVPPSGQSSTMYPSNLATGNGAQTGDALGKALASVREIVSKFEGDTLGKSVCRSTLPIRALAASALIRPHLYRHLRRSRQRRASRSGRGTVTLSMPCSRQCRTHLRLFTTKGTFTW